MRAILLFSVFILFIPPEIIITLGFWKFHQLLPTKDVILGCKRIYFVSAAYRFDCLIMLNMFENETAQIYIGVL